MFAPVGTEEIIPRKSYPIVTAAIVAVNVLFFLYEIFILITEGQVGVTSFFGSFGLVPAYVISGKSALLPYYLTFFTSMFIHAGLLHILSNMIFLAVFGDNVEDMMGRAAYLAFYLVCGLAAAAAQIAADPTSMIPNVGASGAIAGVLAGYLVLLPSGTVRLLLFFGFFYRITKVPALLFISVWFIIQIFSGVASLGVVADTGGVAYWAHVGGFVAGLILASLHKAFMRRQLYPGY
ncbi:MAG: rhomboid family intramembrane serine protease [Methanothrix sp.]